MPIGDTIREMWVKVGFDVDPASEEKMNTSLTGAVIKGNLLADAIKRITSEMVSSFSRAADGYAHLYGMLDRTGANVSGLQAMEYASKQLGINVNSIDSALESFTNRLRQNPNLAQKFEEIVPNFKNIQDPLKQLTAVMEGLRKMPRYQAEQWNKELIGMPQDLFDVWYRKLPEFQELMDKYGKIMGAFGLTSKDTEQAVKNAKELQNAFDDIGVSIRAVYINLMNEFFPDFKDGLVWLQKKILDNKDAIREFGRSVEEGLQRVKTSLQTDGVQQLEKFKTEVLNVKGGIDKVVESIGGWKNAFEAVFAIIEPKVYLILKALEAINSIAEIWKGLDQPMMPQEELEKRRNEKRKQSDFSSPRAAQEQMERFQKETGIGNPMEPKATSEDKNIESHTQATAKNTAEIADALREQKKGWYWNPFTAMRNLWNSMGSVGIGAGQTPGGAGGGGTGPGGGPGGAGGGGTGGGIGGGSTGRGGVGSAKPADRAKAMEVAMDQLRKEGVPEDKLRAAAAMLVGQADMESGLDPTKSHDQGTGYGIYGARNERWREMTQWIKSQGGDPNSLEWQMRQMAHAAMTGWAGGPAGKMKASRDILMRGGITQGDVDLFTGSFESPAVINNRRGAVMQAYGLESGPTGATAGKYVTLGKDARMEGMQNSLMDKFNAAAEEYHRLTGKKAEINEGFRDYTTQARYYRRYLAGIGGIAAPPGRSKHERGMAIDSPQAEEMARLGILQRHGLHQPVLERTGRDAVHIEELNRQVSLVRQPLNDMHSMGIGPSLASNVSMTNHNTFNMQGGGAHEAIQVASLVGRENEKTARRLHNTSANKLREFTPRVT